MAKSGKAAGIVLLVMLAVGTILSAGCSSKKSDPALPPIADFTAYPVSGNFPLVVEFVNQSAGEITSYSWDFNNDGTPDSISRNPMTTYNAAGSYTVSLTVTGPGGSDTETKMGYITVTTPPPPVAAFSASPTSGDAFLDVQFTDQSTGVVTSWSWSFGDGGTSTGQNPQHTYNTPGTYSVSLTVTGPGGSDTETRNNYITVTVPPPPEAGFSAIPTDGDAFLSVQFTDTSTGAISSWSWNFGDGGTSTGQSPQYTYEVPGTYTVSLTVSGPGGSDSETKTDFITVTTPPPPVADFSANNTIGELPLHVQFTDLSTGASVTSWSWDLDGDGTPDSTSRNPSWTYESGGTYSVSLTVSGLWGDDTETKDDYITIAIPPTADFSATPVSGKTPLAVQFADLSAGDVASWYWEFGDGLTSTQQHPEHTYNTVGWYTVTLTVTGYPSTDSCTKEKYIQVFDDIWYVDCSVSSSGGGTTWLEAFKTIKEALFAAGDDDLVLVADGIYTGTGNRDMDFNGDELFLKSENGPANCTIDCGSLGRAFVFESSETADSVLDGFTIQNGSADDGGAVYINNTAPTIINCVIKDCEATGDGGAIFSRYANPAIADCTITGNHAQSDGGAVMCMYSGVAKITGCTISNNTCGGRGAAVFCESADPVITGCDIDGNSASFNGGAISCRNSGNPVSTGCNFRNNSTGGSGAVIYGDGSSPEFHDCLMDSNTAGSGGCARFYQGGAPKFIDCTMTNNEATSGDGGAIALFALQSTGTQITNCIIMNNTAACDAGAVSCDDQSRPTITNSLIAGNTAGDEGGGIYGMFNAYPTISNCTIVGNHANKGGGINLHLTPQGMTLNNCIIWGNTADSEGSQLWICYNSQVVLNYSDFADNALDPDNIERNSTGILTQNNCKHLDPVFASGPKGSYYLSNTAAAQAQDSPCIDAGSGTAASLGLDAKTTRTDSETDTGTIDIGYHYIP